MQITRGKLTLSLGLLVMAVMACKMSATTANISSVKIGHDAEITKEDSNFEPEETIHVVATISNAPGKVKVRGRLVIVDVPGQKKGPVPGLEKTLDLPGSTTASYTFTPPPSGWPAGSYEIEVIMMNEDGEQKDQKTVSFKVS